MVCFTQHIFRFARANSTNWFNLLCKYYPEVEFTATLSDSHTDRIWQTQGNCSMDHFQHLVSSDWTNCEITTERFWAELASIRSMPPYVNTEIPEEMNSTNNLSGVLATVNTIDGIIASRLSHGGNEIFLSGSCHVDNFDDLVKAFYLISNIDHITRLYISQQNEVIVFVLDDRHTIVANVDEISDGTTPVFDVDDGFGMGTCGNEWNQMFQTWLTNFKNSNGATWNDPVIE
jgi:hypothetical protein